MIALLLLVAGLSALAAAWLGRDFARDLRAELGVRPTPLPTASDRRERTGCFVGALTGDGRLEDLDGARAIFVQTTARWITRGRVAGGYQVTSVVPGDELQPAARVVPLSLRDRGGGEVAVADLAQLAVEPAVCDVVEREVPVDALAARYPWVPAPTDPAVTQIVLEQRVLRDGVTVGVRGALRRGVDREGEHGYRDDAVTWELGAGAGGVFIGDTGASSAWARRALACALLLVAATTLLASSWEAATRAWWLR